MAKLNKDTISVEIDVRTSKAREEMHKLSNENKELQKQNQQHRKTISDLAKAEGDHSAAIKNLNQQIVDNNAKIRENNREVEKLRSTIDTSGKTLGELKKELKNLNREFENTSKATNPQRYEELRSKILQTKKAIEEAENSTKDLGSAFSRVSKMKEVLNGFFLSIGQSIMENVVGAFKNAFDTIVDFDRENAKLAGILGTTRDGIKDLTEAAKELGATTSYTAAQVTSLQVELAKLGFNKEQILDMEQGVMKFAKAVDTDLASAAAFAGAALRIFDKDAKDTEDVLATFAIATTKTSLDFSKLESSLATIGPVAHSFGLTVADTAALLGQLANAGFDASSAATATRNILLNLCDSSGALAQALGHPVTNLDELASGLQQLSAEGVDLAKALDLTDKRSVAAFQTFLDQSGTLIELRDSISGVTGEFNQMYDTMSDTADSGLAAVSSAAEGFILKFFDFSEAIKTVCQWLVELINWVGSVLDAFSPLGEMLGVLANGVGTVVVGLGKFVGWLSSLITQTKLGRAMLNGIVAALVSYKVASIAAAAATKLSITNIKTAIKTGAAYIASLGKKVVALFADAAANVKAAIATRSFNAALMANPIMLVVGLIATLTAAIIGYNSVTNEVTKSTHELNEEQDRLSQKTKELAEKRKKMAADIDVEKQKLLELHKVANDENQSKENRLKAINELNRICPTYNGHLDAERGKLIANKKALDDYIASMEKRMRIEYFKDEYKEYIAAQAEAERELYRAKKAVEDLPEADVEKGNQAKEAQQKIVRRTYYEERSDATSSNVKSPLPLGELPKSTQELEKELKAGEDAKKVLDDLVWAQKKFDAAGTALEWFKKEMEGIGIEIVDLASESEEATSTLSEGLGGAGKTTSATVDEIKNLRAELKKLRKQEAQDDDEYKRIQARKKEIQDRIKELEGKATATAKNKGKHHRTPGTYKDDSLDEATAGADDLHQKNMLDINKRKGMLTSAEYIIAKNREVIRYSKDLMAALEELRSKTDSTHTQTLDKIGAEENKILQNVVAAQQAIDKANVQIMTANHKKTLDDLTEFSEMLKAKYQNEVNNGKMHAEAMSLWTMSADMQLHKDRLAELERYYKEVENCESLGEADRKQMLDKLAVNIRTAWQTVLTDTGKYQEKLRNMSTDTSSLAGFKASIEYQIEGVRQTYDEMIKIAQKRGDDIVGLEEQKTRRIEALNYQLVEAQYQAQETVGLSWSDEYDRELAKLQHMHAQGLISEKQFQKARLNLQIKNVQKYFDYYAQLAGNMVSAIQQAEIAQTEAKYDVLIQQAKNNGEDTAALEEEKENKKLEIQKKYADLDFAVKISQIIANTAVSIMQAFAQLGPIGGAIAAAMLTATGAAQVVIAKAERDKIKNMSPSNTASKSTQPASAERVLSGYSEGGYTGDGGRYEVAGVVHRGEYVVPMPIMDNPRVIDAVGTIEAIRRNRHGATSPADTSTVSGFSEGGFTGAAAAMAAVDPELTITLKELREALKHIRAYVVLRDIDEARNLQQKSKAPFTFTK